MRLRFVLMLCILLCMLAPVSASVYANETAKMIVYLTSLKAQILGVITGDATLNQTFVNAMASVLYDTKHIDAEIMNLLASWTSGGDAALIDYSEFLAGYISAVQKIKADISSILASDAAYIEALADTIMYQMKIVAEVLRILATT